MNLNCHTDHALKRFILLLAAVPIAAAPMYTLTNIGGVGGSRSDAFAINAFGAVAGSAFDMENRSHGFAYENFVSDLGRDTDARGINAEGQIVGTQNGYATVWKGGSVETLGRFGGGQSTGLSINDYGYVTGASLRTDGQQHAFLALMARWSIWGRSGARGVLDTRSTTAGQIAGSSQTAFGYTQRLSGTKMAECEISGPSVAGKAAAMAINTSGIVAGASTTSSRYFHATLWNSSGAATDLGTLGGKSSYAYGLNDSGYVVGFSYDAEGRSRAFVWTGSMLFDLNDLVTNSPGWSLTAAYGINARGQIVGTGTYMGQSAAFGWIPRSPSPPQ